MKRLRKPEWLKSNKVGSKAASELTKSLRKYHLTTVCEDAKCPNRGECFERGTATFMILGETCTRNCRFCAVDKSKKNLLAPDPQEPLNIARLAQELNLQHIVVTTVTRDDLPDGGAEQFVQVVKEIRKNCNPEVSIELLISDLNGDFEPLKKIVQSAPDVLNHNVETVERLYAAVRPMADLEQSLQVLRRAKEIDPEIITKSGFMVGLGEKQSEVISLLKKLRAAKVDIVTIGQYMQPSAEHYPVAEYVHPDIFAAYKSAALEMGFALVESAPLVRSSYQAEKARNILKKRS
ncbi:MAG: lipoyl synthase [Candidatus Cloacimonadales bacterium]